VSIYNASEFARQVGVSVKTLQRWDREGRLKPLRTPTNRRMYTQEHLDQALELRSAGGRIVAYTRISAGEPDGALGEQRATIERYCNLYGLRVDEWIAEIGDGLDFRRPQLLGLLGAVVAGAVGTLVVVSPDRLAQTGVELIELLCRLHGCQLITNPRDLRPS
jgi:putative resolvase